MSCRQLGPFGGRAVDGRKPSTGFLTVMHGLAPGCPHKRRCYSQSVHRLPTSHSAGGRDDTPVPGSGRPFPSLVKVTTVIVRNRPSGEHRTAPDVPGPSVPAALSLPAVPFPSRDGPASPSRGTVPYDGSSSYRCVPFQVRKDTATGTARWRQGRSRSAAAEPGRQPFPQEDSDRGKTARTGALFLFEVLFFSIEGTGPWHRGKSGDGVLPNPRFVHRVVPNCVWFVLSQRPA